MKPIALALALVALPSLARADLVPPATLSCEGRAEGAACTVEVPGAIASGVCTQSTCINIDYGSRTDAGTWGTIERPCLECVAMEGGSGCSLAGSTPAEAGALAIAGSFSLLFLLRRRRRDVKSGSERG